jgi:hypothetical protein
MRYILWVQPRGYKVRPGDNDFQVGVPTLANALRIGRWLYGNTNAGVQLFDEQKGEPGQTWGEFDASRT